MAARDEHTLLICLQDKSKLTPMTIPENCWEVDQNMSFTELSKF